MVTAGWPRSAAGAALTHANSGSWP